jgi:hypothetical protein
VMESMPRAPVEILHGFHSHPGQPGRNDPDRFRTFAFAEDVLGIDILTIPFDRDNLEVTESSINVAASPFRHQILLNEEPDTELLGPFKDNDVGTKQAKTHKAMYIPFQFTALVIGQHLNARQAFEVLVWQACCSSSKPLFGSAPITLQARLGIADRLITPIVAKPPMQQYLVQAAAQPYAQGGSPHKRPKRHTGHRRIRQLGCRHANGPCESGTAKNQNSSPQDGSSRAIWRGRS